MIEVVFQKSCRDVASRFQVPTLHLQLPEKTHIAKLCEALNLSGAVDKTIKDLPTLNSVAQTILEHFQQGKELTTKQLRQAPWCFWETKPALADYPDILQRILNLILSLGKRRLFKTLATVYLNQFQKNRQGLGVVSQALQSGVVKFGSPWLELQENFALYDIENGPVRIAQLALQQKLSVPEIMRDLDLSALSAQSGFSEAVTHSILKRLSEDRKIGHLSRLKLVKRYALSSDGKQLFPAMDADIAEALIRPFLARHKTPDDDTKDPFLDTLIKLFEDPRLNPGRWEKMPEIKSEIIAWLTKQSLRQFLDIVDRITTKTSEKRMWKYRRAFWEAVYENGLIRGAWVVFAEDGARETQRIFGNEVKFGRFRKGGGRQAQSSHAVLLLQIGQGVVSDWSHNGKVNIWSSAEDSSAPKLYNSWYDADEVRYYVGRSDLLSSRDYLVKTHSSPDTYSWQKVVAKRIFEMTNKRLHQWEYKA
ncbi:EH signature domain-containing protein [Cohaesibacter celericrescens]|uniref:Zorya protein ZorC EH domain-containing protein n=1 Tax=Cohaesibacter celericrescens TaxID=2067669 RepID=A0A2N5XT49_9HYPH|nr:EH signature domain-containing protein [Cohaesibacter celericrescens]PLW77682.1 hypothetical protein C0081_10360 [Cohaesibacter celericrescens]